MDESREYVGSEVRGKETENDLSCVDIKKLCKNSKAPEAIERKRRRPVQREAYQ